ncbi:MAG: MoaF-related domain-containing protein, partial [Vicinamibacteria bacterium]
MSSAKVAAGALALVALLAATSSAQEKPMSFVGKTLVLRYESGLEVKARYKSATELEWEALAGPAKGRKGTETIASVPVAPDVFFISWLE